MLKVKEEAPELSFSLPLPLPPVEPEVLLVLLVGLPLTTLLFKAPPELDRLEVEEEPVGLQKKEVWEKEREEGRNVMGRREVQRVICCLNNLLTTDFGGLC